MYNKIQYSKAVRKIATTHLCLSSISADIIYLSRDVSTVSYRDLLPSFVYFVHYMEIQILVSPVFLISKKCVTDIWAPPPHRTKYSTHTLLESVSHL